jgi:RHS repeat-associated protein
MVVISDKKIGVDVAPADGIIDYYNADVISAQDYYPFGMTMPGRKYAQANSSYRYGFNGKENDKDAGAGIQDYGRRIYDNRLARFLSVDPLQADYPWWSPYHFAGCSPILNVDLDGLETYNYNLLIDEATGKSKLVLTSVEHGSLCDALTVQKVHYNNQTYTIAELNYKPYHTFGDAKKTWEGKTQSEVDDYVSTHKSDEDSKAEQRQKDEDMYTAMATRGLMKRTLSAKTNTTKASTPAGKVEEKSKAANGGTSSNGDKNSTAGNASNPVKAGNTNPAPAPGNKAAQLIVNQSSGASSEAIVQQRLQSQLGANEAILVKPRIYINGGSGKYAVPDFAVYNKNTGAFVRLVDAKDGNATLSNAQQQVNQHGGTFNGSSRAKDAKAQTVGKNSIQEERTNVNGSN